MQDTPFTGTWTLTLLRDAFKHDHFLHSPPFRVSTDGGLMLLDDQHDFQRIVQVSL